MMNFIKVKKFTEQLYELLVVQKFTLKESLELMEEGCVDKAVGKAASECLESLEKGSDFSMALAKCKSITFDDSYLCFVGNSLITGKLGESISFLKEKWERSFENKIALLTAMIYPLFVISLSVAGAVFLLLNQDLLVMEELAMEKGNLSAGIIKSVVILLIMAGTCFWIIFKNIGENKIYEAFLCAGFLIKSGLNVSASLGYAVLITGAETKVGRTLAAVKQKMEFGMDFKSAFSLACNENCFFIWGSELKNTFYYVQSFNSKEDVFEKIAAALKIRDERKRKIILNLVEPLFIGITGVFLLMLVMNSVMPVLTGIRL